MKNKKHINFSNKKSLVKSGLAIVFFVLAISAYSFSFFNIDLPISRFLQSIHNPIFAFIMSFVSAIGNELNFKLIVGAIVLTMLYAGYKLDAFKFASSTLIAVLVGSLVKKLVGRPRPVSDLVTIQDLLVDKSFPSLHVLLFTVVYGYLIYFARNKMKVGWQRNIVISVSLFLILTIGISRIYLGAHWGSDTLGGYLLGALIFLYATQLKQKNN